MRISVALALTLVLVITIRQLLHPLVLLFAAVVLASALAPAVDRLERWLPRALVVVLVYSAVFALIGAVLWLVLPTLFIEAIRAFSEFPEMPVRLRGVLARVVPFGSDPLIEAVRSQLLTLSGVVLSLPMLIFSAAVEIVLVVVMSVYWLIVLPSLRRFVLSLVPQKHREPAKMVLSEIGSTMGGFVRATVINGVIVGLVTYIGLRIIGVEFPLVLSLVAGLGELIPMVGPFLAGIPAVAVAFLDGSLTQAVVVLVFYVAVQQVENHLLVPYVMHKQADIPPLLAVFALFAGAWVGGALWVLIAVPLAGALRVMVVRIVAPLVRQWTGAGLDSPLALKRPDEAGGPEERRVGVHRKEDL